MVDSVTMRQVKASARRVKPKQVDLAEHLTLEQDHTAAIYIYTDS